MNAVDILKAARAAGVELRLDGDDLALSAASAPPAAVLDALSRHKPEIVALLRLGRDGWSGEDWQVYFGERAGVAEFDGGLPQLAATALAFECCVVKWLDLHPVRSPGGRCIVCGLIERAGDPVQPFGTKDTGAAWMHLRCWPEWRQIRRAEATTALLQIGITPEGARAMDI